MTEVLLTSLPDSNWATQLRGAVADAAQATANPGQALALAETVASIAPRPGEGSTVQLWELLASLGAADLTVARAIEPHLDAVAILAEAGLPVPEGTWGVFAAEGAGMRVDASITDGQWMLTGVKPWCSLAARLDHALITAHTAEGTRLFSIDLHHSGVSIAHDGWVARGLRDVVSGSIELQDVPAHAVGDTGWYVSRPGFAWGGAGVAAVWFGASVALARALFDALISKQPDQIGLFHLGSVDVELNTCRAVLVAASREIDTGSPSPAIVAQRVRSTVARAAEHTLTALAHALGPAPLATDEDHARRVADLELYVRQDHAERDIARLGGKLLEQRVVPW